MTFIELKATVKLSKEFQNRELDVKAELVESGAFSYGNGTATRIIATDPMDGSSLKRTLDTRYVRGIKSDHGFRQFLFDELSAYYGDNAIDIVIH